VFEGKPYLTGSLFKRLERTWTPPAMIRPIKGVPVYLLLRGFCEDEDRLGCLVRDTWERIPESDRQAMRKYLEKWSEDHEPFNQGALRIEAIPNWPERGRAIGVCMDWGRAIRLHSPTLDAMPDDVARTLLAHELAHVFQLASDYRNLRKKYLKGLVVLFRNEKSCKKLIEEDAIEVMMEWGFKDETIDHWLKCRADEREKAREEKREREWQRIKAEAASME